MRVLISISKIHLFLNDFNLGRLNKCFALNKLAYILLLFLHVGLCFLSFFAGDVAARDASD